MEARGKVMVFRAVDPNAIPITPIVNGISFLKTRFVHFES